MMQSGMQNNMHVFDFDANLAMRQVRTMEQCADELLIQRRQITATIAALRASWEGDAAALYIRKLEAFGGNLEINAHRLRKEAVDFTNRVNHIVAELEALRNALNTIGQPGR